MALVLTARGTGGNQGNATTIVCTVGSNYAAGSTAVLVVAYDNNGASFSGSDGYASIADSRGNTWTPRLNVLRDPGSGNQGTVLRIFTSEMNVATLQAGDTVTITLDQLISSKARLFWEVKSDASGTISVTGQNGAGGSGTTPSTTSDSIPAGDLVIGGLAYEEDDAVTADADSTNGSWSAQQTVASGASGASSQTVASQGKVTTGTATQTYNPTYATSSDYAIGWIAFHETVAAGGGARSFGVIIG